MFVTRIASSRRHARALIRAVSSDNVRFRFHLECGGRSPDTIWLQKKLTRRRAFAGRKLSSMTVLCSVYREHIATNTRGSGRGPVKAGARDEGTCPLFFFRTSLFSFVLSLRDRKRVSIVSYSKVLFTAGHGPILPRANTRRRCACGLLVE